jgi:DNA-binding transcriptional regulator YiaG
MRKFFSEACEVIYQDAVALFEIGAITEAELKEYDEDCFIDEDETPGEKNLLTEHESA